MRILSLDGGGIKGTMTARLLERLETYHPKWIESVDLFAGTSTGGILALALASGLKPAECVELYRANGKAIFAGRGFFDKITGGIVRADYTQDGLRGVLTKYFGDKRLKDLEKDVLVPAFDMRRWCPKFFDRGHDGEAKIVDVALATSAAPTYFPAFGWVEDEVMTIYADGGLFANNPSDSALAFVSSGGGDLTKTCMLSIGTGADAPPPPKGMLNGDDKLDFGYRNWILKSPHYLLSALFEGSVTSSHFRSREQLNDRYHRIQPALAERIEMDDPTKIDDLLVTADRFDIDDTITWLKTNWNG